MNDFTTNLTTLLVGELNAFARDLDLYPDDASVWKTAPGITNSAGNLALHVAGNRGFNAHLTSPSTRPRWSRP